MPLDPEMLQDIIDLNIYNPNFCAALKKFLSKYEKPYVIKNNIRIYKYNKNNFLHNQRINHDKGNRLSERRSKIRDIKIS